MISFIIEISRKAVVKCDFLIPFLNFENPNSWRFASFKRKSNKFVIVIECNNGLFVDKLEDDAAKNSKIKISMLSRLFLY